MPLPTIIRAELEHVNPETTQEDDYYGAYNLLLGHAFAPADGYVVHPQVACKHDVLHFTVYFRTDSHKTPVFFAEVGSAQSIACRSARADADERMRLRVRQLFDQSLTELHGISALGTRLCFYCLDKARESVSPPPIPRDAAYVSDTAPAERWDADILDEEGYDRFMDVVEHVKGVAVAEAHEACVVG